MNAKIYKFAFFLIIIASVVSFGIASTTKANCTLSAQDISWYQPVHVSISVSDSQAVATITNTADCDAPMSVISYKMYDEVLSHQVFYDGGVLTMIPAHSTQTLTVSHPDCSTQIDVYYGTGPHELLDSNPYSYPNVPFVMGWNYYKHGIPYCTNTPPPLVCAPANQTVDIDSSANFSATGGSGTYSWTSPGGNPANGSGTNYSTSYSSSGSKAVVVSDGSQSATCSVTVNPSIPQLICSPANQSVNVGDSAHFSASGGTGTYSWTSSGGNPANGSGVNFDTSYSASGNKTATVTSGTQTAQCNVNVNQPVQTLICSPFAQSGNVNDILNFHATGGAGTYSWTSPGSPSSGTGANFSSAFSTPGSKTVTVTDGSQTAQCSASINQPPATLTCAPSAQTVNVNDVAVFSATGGNGNYAWTSPGNPSSGVGTNFSSAFSNAGAKTVTVTDGSQTAQCNVNVNQVIPQLSCTPSVQNGNVNDSLTFNANGGAGSYSWFTSDGSPSAGNSSTFTTQFYTSGNKTITVTSGAQSAQCTANINQPQQSQQQVYCNPQNQNANAGDWVNFNATGGSGNYYWFASGDASPSNGNGTSFGTRFSSSGTKIVTVNSSAGGNAQCLVNINTQQQNLNFQITKNVLNRTLGQSVYVNNVEAQQQDMVEFEIRIQTNNYGSYSNSYQIFLRDALPYGLSYVSGSTRVNGNQVPDGITQSVGINLNNNYNQEQVVRFLATVDQGRTSGTFINQAFATINSDTQSASASVTVRPRGTVLGAADIVTGPEDAWPAALGLGFLAALLVYYFYFMKGLTVKSSGLRIRVIDALPIAEKPKRKTELESILEKIKAGENEPDA